VGRNDGFLVGRNVCSVGIGEGFWVGSELGAIVGFVGEVVGTYVAGALVSPGFVGYGEGFLVGNREGTSVGCFVVGS
jgi:hypothetical protein